jgi:hypothetical protein
MCVYVYVRESPTPLKGEEKVTKEKIFIQILIVCGEENQHLSAARKNKKERRANVRRISRAVSIVSCSFTGNASAVEETCKLTFCLFSTPKVFSSGKDIFAF